MDRPLEQLVILSAVLDALLKHFKQGDRRDVETGLLTTADLVGERGQQMGLTHPIGTDPGQRALGPAGKRPGRRELLGLPLLFKRVKGLLQESQIGPLPPDPGVDALLLLRALRTLPILAVLPA